nr:ABC transporter permease [Pseudomonadota bacterium]
MPYDKPHAVSPGLWALAWRRLRADKVAMVSLTIVAAFLLLMVLSGTGLIAKNWSKEVGVNYAPPSFVGADAETAGNAAGPTASSAGSPESEAPTELPVVDPLADE